MKFLIGLSITLVKGEVSVKFPQNQMQNKYLSVDPIMMDVYGGHKRTERPLLLVFAHRRKVGDQISKRLKMLKQN